MRYLAWVGVLGVPLLWLGCSSAPPEPTETACPQAAVEEGAPEFASDREAADYFEQMAEQAHAAVLRYEHALRSLREDRRWEEPDQRIWLSIATTETLTAIEENRRDEQHAKQQLELLASR